MGSKDLYFNAADSGDIVFSDSALNQTGRIWNDGISLKISGTSSTSANLLSIGGSIFTYNNNTVWHAGNSNISTVDWAVKNLTMSEGRIITPNCLQVNTDFGYAQFGPQNPSHCHIYTDRPSFYFNKDILINGNSVWHAGNDGAGSGLDADLLDGLHKDNLVYWNGEYSRFGGDLNTLGRTGTSGIFNIGYNVTNSAFGNNPYGTLFAFWNSDISTQLHIPYNGDRIAWRKSIGTTYAGSTWKYVWDSDSFDPNSKANTSGTYSSLNVGYATSSGNSATATNISNTGTVNLASATEANSITITQPSYSTDKPVKLLNFNWYTDAWSIGNIRSGSTPSNGLGIYLNSVEKFRFSDGVLKIGANTVWHAGNDGSGSGLDADLLDGYHRDSYFHKSISDNIDCWSLGESQITNCNG